MNVSFDQAIMKSGHVLGVLFLLTLSLTVNSKVFRKCDVTNALLKINFHQKSFLSNWVCLMKSESNLDTAAHVVKSSKNQFYGIFQIGSEWCKEGRKGGKCNIACESLLDDDINDDSQCAYLIFQERGFRYWPKWESKCKGKDLPDIHKCASWIYGP